VTRAEIEREVLGLIAGGVSAPPDDRRFETLALPLLRLQVEQGAAYRKLCAAFGRDPRAVRSWREIPAVPTGAFKEARFAIFPPEATVRTFRSSGTTADLRGALELDDLSLYDASLEETFRTFVVGDAPRRRFLVLAPSSADAPDSSLSYMFSRAVERMGTGDSEFLVGARGWDPERAIETLAAARESVVLAGTAFAFVHLLDQLEARGEKLALPEGTRVMETGGFKGRSRELTRDELHAQIAEKLGVPRTRIVNQYGMCELASQFYESTLRDGVPSDVKQIPPWVRVRIVNPVTQADVPHGERGIILVHDLANVGSVAALLTADVGQLADGGFRVFGRARGAEARGCSLAADALLGAVTRGAR